MAGLFKIRRDEVSMVPVSFVVSKEEWLCKNPMIS
jgi:hypothetical protein